MSDEHQDDERPDENKKRKQDGDEQQSGDRKNENGDDEGGDDENGDEGEKKPSLFSKPIFWIILIVVVGALVIGGVLYWLHARKYESTDDAFVDAHIVRIAPQVSGLLVQVADIDNRHVEPGRLLAVVQPDGPQAQLAEAQGNEKQAEAQVETARAQVSQAISQRQQSVAKARAPLADAEKAEADLNRYQQLLGYDKSAVSGQQLDDARSKAMSTRANAVAAQRDIANADAQIEVAKRQVTAAQAVVAARKAAIAQANVTIGNLRLTAPVAGQVVNRSVNLGSYVSPGTQLMAIVPDHMWITANFKETQLTHMQIGQPVRIRVDAYPNIEFRGRIDSVQRGAGQAFALLPPQNATGNYVKVVQRVPVRIEFVTGKDEDGKDIPDPRKYPIGPGMSVVPTVEVR